LRSVASCHFAWPALEAFRSGFSQSFTKYFDRSQVRLMATVGSFDAYALSSSHLP
jgi:hypothetical protein